MNRSFIKNFSQKFLLASFADKRTVVYVLIWSMAIRFMIFFLPFKTYRHRLGKLQEIATREPNSEEIKLAKHLQDIVESVCNHTPWRSKCLVQAIICKQLLKKRGVQTTLYLGVFTQPENHKLISHAWLKAGEVMLTGARGHKKFKVVNYYG